MLRAESDPAGSSPAAGQAPGQNGDQEDRRAKGGFHAREYSLRQADPKVRLYTRRELSATPLMQ